MGVRLGLEAKLYHNAADFSGTMEEIKNVKDLTLNIEAGEADASTRGNNGWKATLATLKDGSIEFEMVWDTSDAAFTAIRTAFFNGTAIGFAILDGDITETGTQGLKAAMVITNFSRNEPLEEAITVSVTAKPTYSTNPPEWMVV